MSKQKDESELAEHFAEITDLLAAGNEIGTIKDKELRDLVETVVKLQTATRSPAPSPSFAARLRKQALDELPAAKATISERLHEVIARLLGEEDFRNSFFASPEPTLQRAGFQLSAAEIAALKEMEPDNMKEWFSELDERISKSGLPGAHA